MGYLQDELIAWELPPHMRLKWQLDELPKAKEHIKTFLSWDSPGSPPVVDIEKVYRILRSVASGQQSMEALSRRELKIGVWAVFKRFQDNLSPLYENIAFFRRFVEALNHTNSPRVASGLVLNFLEEYPNASQGFDLICGELSSALSRAGPRLNDMKARVGQYHLLNRKGPEFIANEIVNGHDTLSHTLERCYLVSTRAREGIVAEVHTSICADLNRGLSKKSLSGNKLSRILEFCSFNESGKDLRITAQRKELANALLAPFLSVSPEPEIRNRIKKFVLDYFGDPRTKKAQWQGVEAGPRSVITRWLVQDTFEDFCRIVDLTQDEDSDADRQWPYRRAFWLAYFKKDVITDAWLVLGNTIANRAKRKLGIESANYAKLEGQVKPTHAVLILKIQNYVITEWSHAGKYRLWHESDSNTPKFYLPAYSRSDLIMRPAVENSHHSAESGSWQRRLANVIRGRTGISVSQKEFMEGV